LIKRFVSKAKVPITLLTANPPTRTEHIANIHIRELDENITPYVLENTLPVLTVGYRCMELGSTFYLPYKISLFHSPCWNDYSSHD
jgi:hypothetical protein